MLSRKQIKIPCLDGNGEVCIAHFDEFKKENINFPPIFAIRRLPEESIIGSGAMGQVYLVSQNDSLWALKLDRLARYRNVREGQQFTLTRKNANCNTIHILKTHDNGMHASFDQSYNCWISSRNVPCHKNIAGINSLVFVEDLNQWGELYEYIKGDHLSKFCRNLKQLQVDPRIITQKILQMAIQLAEGLSVLDESELPHRDLMEPNILVRQNTYEPVLIDYTRKCFGIKIDSPARLESRCQFGGRLLELARVLGENDQGLNQCAKECSDKRQSLQNLSWKDVIKQLYGIQSTFNCTMQAECSAYSFNLANQAIFWGSVNAQLENGFRQQVCLAREQEERKKLECIYADTQPLNLHRSVLAIMIQKNLERPVRHQAQSESAGSHAGGGASAGDNNDNTPHARSTPQNQIVSPSDAIIHAMEKAVKAATDSWGVSWSSQTKSEKLQNYLIAYRTAQGIEKDNALKNFILTAAQARRPLFFFGIAQNGHTASAQAFYESLTTRILREEVRRVLGSNKTLPESNGANQSVFAEMAEAATTATTL